LYKKPIISVFNLKHGVGCSALTWNIAHTLELNIYQHEQAMHHIFIDQRNQSVEITDLYENNITANFINKRVFESGIYDLGSEVNYPYVRQILSKSDAIVIPCEIGYEVMLKTIASIKYAQQTNPECKIYVVFNKLVKPAKQKIDNALKQTRERNYTEVAENFIESNVENMSNIEFLYIRYAFAIFRDLSSGCYYLDHFVFQGKVPSDITSFQLLRNLRWYTLDKQKRNSRRKEKGDEEIEKSEFYDKHKLFYNNYFKDFPKKKQTLQEKKEAKEPLVDVQRIYDTQFNGNNTKIIKDMLILTTKIKEQYSTIWDDTNE